MSLDYFVLVCISFQLALSLGGNLGRQFFCEVPVLKLYRNCGNLIEGCILCSLCYALSVVAHRYLFTRFIPELFSMRNNAEHQNSVQYSNTLDLVQDFVWSCEVGSCVLGSLYQCSPHIHPQHFLC